MMAMPTFWIVKPNANSNETLRTSSLARMASGTSAKSGDREKAM